MNMLRHVLLWCALCGAPAWAAGEAQDAFAGLLRDNVSAAGAVNYPGIKADPRLAEYLGYLAAADPDSFATNQQRLAFWINAYNALAIKGILDGLSPDGLFARVIFFRTTDYTLAGREINLYDLERDIIIPFNEPRIHFAINCASASCPILGAAPYVADRLEPQLEAAARAFINDPAKNRFDLAANTASISKIFDWFQADFERAAGSVQKYLASYVADPEAAARLAQDGFELRYLDYDWSLNGAPVR